MSVVIASGVTGTEFPRIGWKGISGTITASSAANGFGAGLAATPQTYAAWRAINADATWEIDAGESVAVDYCGIGAHDLATVGATVAVQRWTGSAWVTVASTTPTDDSAILFLFPSASATKWRISITGATSAARIGNIRFGLVTTLPQRSTFAPALPITEAEEYGYNVNLSVTGEWLGRSVVSTGLQFSVTISHLSEEFASGEWADFRAHCNTGDATFFIAPKPAAYPKEVAYAWPTETVKAERNFPNKNVSRIAELQCAGYKRP